MGDGLAEGRTVGMDSRLRGNDGWWRESDGGGGAGVTDGVVRQVLR